MRLYRPVGIRELELIKKSQMKRFPPRLPEQPIFYPVLNVDYARQITQEWNAKSAPDYVGFVTEFDVDDDYISMFNIETVGNHMHKELWVPAEELDNFNNHIIGSIRVIESYYGEEFKDLEYESTTSIEAIERLKSGDTKVLKDEKWLMFLALTSERNINFERISSLSEIKNNYVLEYVEKTLKAFSNFRLNRYNTHIIDETLRWCEVAKSGLSHQRKQWIKKGFNLFAHNIGSAQVYLENSRESNCDIKTIIYSLILTHGLIGQYIRGEVSLIENKPLYKLIEDNKISAAELKSILYILNYCIICAVDEDIWTDINNQVKEVIELIITGQFDEQYDVRERIRRLRAVSIKNGENFDWEYEKNLSDPKVLNIISNLLKKADLWYVEAALFDFSFEEFIKIFLIISQKVDLNKVKHISFEWLMKDIYYQREGKKKINIYKKRIIEKFLSQITICDILQGNIEGNLHVNHSVTYHKELDDTVFFAFSFSDAGSKLIDFCVEAEKSDVIYESAIIMIFDFFELRKDKYDRFYEEETYLKTMNKTIDYKKVILNYIVGDSIIDIGPGGGALMNLIEEKYPDKKVIGVDISHNVLETLKKKKQLEKRKWDVLYGDALSLGQYIKSGSINTIIFCSILHELFSYIDFNGKKFNHETLKAALKSAFEILPEGGRIIIRDGIMTEPLNQKRIIRFLSEEGIEFLKRYAKDFKGRDIKYNVIGHNEVKMPINDAMEFLYTYTWGEKSYVHEVKEQFGYFTPTEFKEFINVVLGTSAKIIEFKNFLQEGYTIALSSKIEFYDENRKSASLPDSTCIVVIEKK
ncbi:UNVERIFIED_CONTAM: Methylase involved in ubiquinone/menaquinone biosynthesis [Acetivibrio alkalicellulosi]